MILLEFGNQIIMETIRSQLDLIKHGERAGNVEMKVAEFDSVQYHIWSHPDNGNLLMISISWGCFDELKSYGAETVLKQIYGDHVAPTESGYDFTLQLDLSTVPADDAGRNALLNKMSLFKRNALAAPFERAFDAQAKGEETDLMQISYRAGEAIWVKAHKDRVTVIFKTTFKDDVDVIFGEVFLQEFADARRQPALQNSPQVLFYGDQKDPPVELKGVPGVAKQDGVGYVTFVLFPRHFDKTHRENTISLIQTFRDYLHYHIKCSKAYMHSRMRARVVQFLKILNRAKPDLVEKKGDKKKIGGRF